MSEEPKDNSPMDGEYVDGDATDQEEFEYVDEDESDEAASGYDDRASEGEREVPADLVTTSELTKLRVMRRRKPKKDGTVRNPRRLGKVKACVFHPSEKRCIGFLVKRPDLLLMFHRKDWFVALDSYAMEDGRIVVDHDIEHKGPDVCERLGLSWDECVMWTGMPICVASGDQVGYVSSVTFSRSTGEIYSVQAADGVASKLIVGVLDIPADLVVGFKRGIGTELATDEELEEAEDQTYYTGAILVDDKVWDLEPAGGWAEAAGQFTAKVGNKAHEVSEQAKPVVHDAAVKTGRAFNEGAATTGRQINAAKGMFHDFKDQYNKARAGDESDDLNALADSKDIPTENMFAAFRAEFDRARAGEYDDEDAEGSEGATGHGAARADGAADEGEGVEEDVSAKTSAGASAEGGAAGATGASAVGASATGTAVDGADVEYDEEEPGESDEPEIVTREERRTAQAASVAGNMFTAFRDEFRKARDEEYVDETGSDDEAEDADAAADAAEDTAYDDAEDAGAGETTDDAGEYEEDVEDAAEDDEAYEEEYDGEEGEYEEGVEYEYADDEEYEDDDAEYEDDVEYEDEPEAGSAKPDANKPAKDDDFDLGKRVSGMFAAFKEEYDKGKNE